jgi:hypothetical protein
MEKVTFREMLITEKKKKKSKGKAGLRRKGYKIKAKKFKMKTMNQSALKKLHAKRGK